MKVQITTTIKNMEMANFLLAQAFESAMQSEAFKEYWNLSEGELKRADQFRKSLVKAIKKEINNK